MRHGLLYDQNPIVDTDPADEQFFEMIRHALANPPSEEQKARWREEQRIEEEKLNRLVYTITADCVGDGTFDIDCVTGAATRKRMEYKAGDKIQGYGHWRGEKKRPCRDITVLIDNGTLHPHRVAVPENCIDTEPVSLDGAEPESV